MNIRTFLLCTLAGVALCADIAIKVGTKPADAVCRAPMECEEPLYCLNFGGGSFKCGKKPCDGAGECRIGQFCSKGLCDVITCENDEECPGNMVCQTNAKCSNKSAVGQKCGRNAQCWTGSCVDGICAKKEAQVAPASTPEATPEAEEEGNIVSKSVRRLTGGGIVGIILGALLLLALCCIILFCCRNGRGQKN